MTGWWRPLVPQNLAAAAREESPPGHLAALAAGVAAHEKARTAAGGGRKGKGKSLPGEYRVARIPGNLASGSLVDESPRRGTY